MGLEVYYRLDVNIVAFIVLGIYVLIALTRLDLSDALNRLFLFVSVVVLTQLLIEAGTVWINRQDNLAFVPLSHALHMILFMVGPIIAMSWFYFLLHLVLDRREIPVGIHILAGTLLMFSLFTAAASPLTGWVFTVTDQNVYQRGPFFIAQGLITYVYLFAATTLTFIFRRRILPSEQPLLYVFGLLPIVGGLFQVFIYGVLSIWSSVAFTLVIGYVFLQERMMKIDFLSQAITRESFIRYMTRELMRGATIRRGIVFIDMDHLKAINDKYGHAEGDQAIITLVRVIKENMQSNEMVVRMGGDEFLLVLNAVHKTHLKDRMDAIMDAFGHFNAKKIKPYTLSFSYGADVFFSDKDELEAFIRRLDHQMYQAKQQF